MDDKTLLWNLYQDNRAQAQFHETQRTNGSALIGGGAAVIVASIAEDGHYSREDLPLSVILILLGIFGFLYCLKTSECMQVHLNRCRRFLPMLDKLDDTMDLVAIKDDCDAQTALKHPFSSKVTLRKYWEGMHLLIALTGVLFLGRILL